jgi:ankyrin repeat protein
MWVLLVLSLAGFDPAPPGPEPLPPPAPAPERPKSELFAAIDALDADRVRWHFIHGGDPNETNEHGEPALHVAITTGNMAVIGAVLGGGASVGVRNGSGGDNALRRLVAMPLDAGITAVLARSYRDLEGRTALHWAVLDRRFELIGPLLQSGAYLMIDDDHGVSVVDLIRADAEIAAYVRTLPLSEYAQSADGPEAFEALVGLGVTRDELTEMFWWIATYRPDLLEVLVRMGVDVTGDGGNSALSVAAERNDMDAVNMLLAAGAPTELPPQWTFTGVDDLCMGCGCRDTSKDWAWVYPPGPSPLEAAVPHPAMVERLLRAGAKVTPMDGWSPALSLAVQSGPMESVKLLATPDGLHAMYKGRSPLHDAVRSGRVDVAEELIRRGASVNDRTWPNGETPYRLAVEAGNQAMVEVLARAGIPEYVGPIPAPLAEGREVTGGLLGAGFRSDMRVYQSNGRMYTLSRSGEVSEVVSLETLDGLLEEIRTPLGAEVALAFADVVRGSPTADFLTGRFYARGELSKKDQCARRAGLCAGTETTKLPDGWAVVRTLYYKTALNDPRARRVRAMVRTSGRIEFDIEELDTTVPRDCGEPTAL